MLPEGLTDESLEVRLYPPPAVAAEDCRPQPDWRGRSISSDIAKARP
jgi:hypothetical protein